MSHDESAPHAPPVDRRGWFARMDRAALIATPTLIVASAFITRLDAVTSVASRRARQRQVDEARRQAPSETLRGPEPA